MKPWGLRWALRALTPAVVLLCGGAVAWGYFSTTGSGSAQASVAGLTAPSAVTATQTGNSVTVTWSAASVTSGTAVDGYRVTRSDNTTICGSPTLVTVLTCTDSAPLGGSATYTVTAVFRTWTASATSASGSTLSAPSITSSPPSDSNSQSASFAFSGGGGATYACQLDGSAFTTCTSPATYSNLAAGSHTFGVRAVSGGSTGPVSSDTWLIDTTAPTQGISLAAGATNAALSGSTLYYRGSVAGSFQLTDTVSDAGSGPASATFAALGASGFTHAAETISTPTGGPYTSSAISWTANPTNPAPLTVTGADGAGNTIATSLTFVSDTTPPTSGALQVNGTTATSGGSSSTIANSTSFPINARTDYTDAGSGLASSVLTVQSESLSGSTCGTAGSGGPFTTATVISATTQPSGILAGYCYLYTLTGTDNVGNRAAVHTTVEDDLAGFTVTTQPATATAGTSTGSTSVVLTATKNGATDTAYTGGTLSWSGASNSPSGVAPTLPTSATWSSGVAKFGLTLVKAESATLSVTDGTRTAQLSPITVAPGAASHVAWTGTTTTSSAGVPSPCLFACAYATSGSFGNAKTWTSFVSVTDADGNVVRNLSTAPTVTLSLQLLASGTESPTTLSIPTTGPATSSATVKYTSPGSGSFSDTLTAASLGLTSATATFK